MRHSIIRLTCLLVVAVFSHASALSQASLTAVAIPGSIADGGGTGTTGYPYAVFVRIQNWTAGANGQAYLKIYSGTNNEYMWTGSAWSNTTAYNASNQPVVAIDASGNWSGWIYAKHNTGLGTTGSVRAARVGATSTNLTSSSKTFSILNTTPAGNGGWLVRTSSPAVNKGILAYAGGAVVGSYRTEDNGITEGYAYAAGGFKIAVPAGVIDSLIALNDDGTRALAFPGPWVVSAGQETDASATAGAIGHGTVRATPVVIQGTGTHTITVTILGENPYVLSHARIFLPARWSWSHAPGDVSVTAGGTPAVTLAGDTIAISGLNLGGSDSARVTIAGIVAPDTTASFVIGAHTGTHPDSIYALGTPPSVYVYGVPLPIATVKANDANGVPLLNNRLVTVRGVVTVANEFGGPSYIQDNTGGMAVFGQAFSSVVAPGDEVVVSGLVQPFSGLTEIVSPILHTLLSSGNVVAPVPVTVGQIAHDGAGGVEEFEGRLVRINNVHVAASGAWAANTNYVVTGGADSTQLRIDNNTTLVGTPIPLGACDIVGVVGQFISVSPYIGGYQLMPRTPSDIISAGPVIATVPVERDMTPGGFRLTWTTVNPGTSRVRYGTTAAYELGIAGNDSASTTGHEVALAGLTPATIYHVQAFSVATGDTSTAGAMLVSTASPPAATGAINVYFNKSVSTTLPPYLPPAQGDQSLAARLLARIGAARTSVDAAFYSLSGSPGTEIANALIAARGRGVSVRVICEADNRNSAALNSLATAGVPLITDTFDPVNAGAGLMHNKFVVIDGRGAGAPDSIWVWTGSWNPTDPGTNADYQNAIELQDPALAGAFVTEFNEMWGSGTETPNAASSRFGARKTDNTPHRFIIGGRPVSCYFSPSDHTTARILDALNGAQASIYFSLLTLTRSDIANALLARQIAGVRVLGAIDSKDDQGSQYDYLVGKGMDIRLKSGSGLLHHKYAVLSADWGPNWDRVHHPTVITGSHNWTNAAENANNENTLIVEDDTVALAYLQEFAARYVQFGGTGSITVGVEEVEYGVPERSGLIQNYPNPFNGMTAIGVAVHGEAGASRHVRVQVFDILGREVAMLVDGPLAPGTYRLQFDATHMASGVYLCTLRTGGSTAMMKMLLLR